MARVLVVDDDRISLTVLETFLADAGHEVRSATSCDEALAFAEDEVPDVLVTDYRLSGPLSGIDLFTKLSARRSDLALVLISGFPKDDLALEVPKGARSVILEKPYELDSVVEQVTRLAAGG